MVSAAITVGIYLGAGLVPSNARADDSALISTYSDAFSQSGDDDAWQAWLANGEASN